MIFFQINSNSDVGFLFCSIDVSHWFLKSLSLECFIQLGDLEYKSVRNCFLLPVSLGEFEKD